ncbi:FtsQ-type POTRA domain-containing protein [bacterium]|nr:FtsQ-type POTRA domain-containing protein [bacterium]
MAIIRALSVLLVFTALCAAESPDRLPVTHIELVGNRTTKDWVILRELRFSVGDSVAPQDLEAARLRLLSLSIFNNARVTQDASGAVSITVSEQFRFIPILSASAVEGTVNDALKEPKRIPDILVLLIGAADINHAGTGAFVGAYGVIGARTGINLEYYSRWLSPKLPLSLEFGARSLKISDRHASVLGYSRRLRNDRAYVKLSTRRGAPSRVGLNLAFDGVKEDDFLPAAGKRYNVGWVAPFVILDRRNLEWYPTEGMFARGDVEQAFGSDVFMMSSAVLAAYLPFAEGSRGPSLAARIYGGTSQNNTPPWSHYYFGFSKKFRGYSAEQVEASTYLSGECEFRFPITREVTYNVPIAGRYGKDIPFWLGGALFFERAQTQLDGTRNDVWAGGAALHIRFPYVQVIEISAARNRANQLDLVFSTGVRF